MEKTAGEKIRLSIIIPYWNAKTYTDELLSVLDRQIRDDVEVIVVDDGSDIPYKTELHWVNVIRKRNGGCASARNRGLKLAKGEYISFIDADDLVPEYFIDRLLDKITGGYDVIDFSWKSLSSAGRQFNYVLRSDDDRLPNPSVCTRAFKRAYIGAIRFNEKKDSTEDEDFSRKVGFLTDRNCKHGAISEYMYFYRTSNDNSKVLRFKKGLMNTKRILYNYKTVTADMTDLLEEIKREDVYNEVWLMTERCDIPELSRYCQICRPQRMWAHYVLGEPTSLVEIITPPTSAQVVMYVEYSNKVGGIATFIYNWCQHMREHYDILVMYGRLDADQIARLAKIVRVQQSNVGPVVCDTVILNRLTDKVPANVTYKRIVQMCHACRQINFTIPEHYDYLINVSQAAKDSWGEVSKDGIVIHNLPYTEHKQALFLVSATRVRTIDKGENDQRIRTLAEMLRDAGIPFIWLNFSDNKLNDMPYGFVNMPATLETQSYIAKADYLVQLSDREAYSMSILEALTNNTAVIATPFPSLFEEGFEDGVHGHVVPFDMKFDVRKLLDVPVFNFEVNLKPIISQWQKILGAKIKQPNRRQITSPTVTISCTKKYFDTVLKRTINAGETLAVTDARAEQICSAGFGRRV